MNSSLKDDLLFVALSGFAKSCLETDPNADLLIGKVAKAINKYFNKNMPFSKTRKLEILNSIKKVLDPKMEELQNINNGKTSPQILMILTLDYLVKEKRHLLSRLKFGHFKLDKLIDDIYSLDRYKQYIKSHSDFIINL